jgi:hypothetical protein
MNTLKTHEVLVTAGYIDEDGSVVDRHGNYCDADREVYSLHDYSLNELRDAIYGSREGELAEGRYPLGEYDTWITWTSVDYRADGVPYTHQVTAFASRAVLELLDEVAP